MPLPIEPKDLVPLLELLAAHDVDEIELEDENLRVRIRRGSGAVPAIEAFPRPGPAVAPAAPLAGLAADEAFVTSPFVGTFYRSPSPDAPPFVSVGDHVRPGQALCIVEAMKLMNEIESDVAGIIVEVLAATGKPVEFGQRLFRVRRI